MYKLNIYHNMNKLSQFFEVSSLEDLINDMDYATRVELNWDRKHSDNEVPKQFEDDVVGELISSRLGSMYKATRDMYIKNYKSIHTDNIEQSDKEERVKEEWEKTDVQQSRDIPPNDGSYMLRYKPRSKISIIREVIGFCEAGKKR